MPCLRDAIESKTTLSRDTCMSSQREFRSGLSQFHFRNEVKQGHKVEKINCRPDYIIERIDSWCRF